MADHMTDWKQQYREAVAELDENERRWRAAEAELQRLLLRALRALATDLAGRADDASISGLRQLSEGGAATDPQALHAHVVAVAEQILEHVALEVRGADRTPGSSANEMQIDELRELALEFVTTLSVPKDQRVRVTAYRKSIEQASTRAEVAMAMLDCATWLSSIFRQLWLELGETTNYLDTLSGYLEQMDHYMRASRTASSAQTERDTVLRNALTSEVTGLSRDMDDADMDISRVRMRVRSACRKLEDATREWTVSTASAHADLDSRLQALEAQLESAQQEADALREAVASSEMRVRLDALTGLSNRIAFEERLAEEMARQQRSNDPLALMVLDIDHFKQVNDNHGHLTGDAVLGRLGGVLRNRLRASDFAARYGGEEFVVVLPRTNRAGAVQAGEEYRRAIASTPFPLKEGPALEVTVSIGVTEVTAEDTPESAFQRADEALYAAKKAGRNRVVAA